LRLFEVQWAACTLIRLLNSNVAEETSNSKSVGHLVLAEEKATILLDEQVHAADQSPVSRHYGARDVSLINSLIGSEFVVRLPGADGTQLKRLASGDVTRRVADNPWYRTATLRYTHSLDSESSHANIQNAVIPLSSDRHEMHPESANQQLVSEKNSFNTECKPDRVENARPVCKQEPLTRPTSAATTPCQMMDTHLPEPKELGHGNPFLLFLCFSLLQEYREEIFTKVTDVSDMVFFFQQKSKKHDLTRILHRARTQFINYLQDYGFFLP
uniref:Lysosomal trafficking regulator lyst n=1 Tax=Echinostoma caproni TaxID=27848 RepID=A0A183BCA1_9TREM